MTILLVDLRRAPGCVPPLRVQTVSISCSFSEIIGQIIVFHMHLWSWRFPSGKSWICHCIFDPPSSCQPSWMAAIAKIHKNGSYICTIQELNTTKYGSIFDINMLSAILLAILDGSHYQKLHKWLPLLLYLRQRLATELNTTMFGQSSMSTCWSSCQPYWMKTYIQKMTKLVFFGSIIQNGD